MSGIHTQWMDEMEARCFFQSKHETTSQIEEITVEEPKQEEVTVTNINSQISEIAAERRELESDRAFYCTLTRTELRGLDNREAALKASQSEVLEASQQPLITEKGDSSLFTYRYSIAVFLASDTCNPHTTISGQVQAERYSHACSKAWPLIHAECARIQSETGHSTGVGILSVRMLAQCHDCKQWFYADDAVWSNGHPHCTDCSQDAA